MKTKTTPRWGKILLGIGITLVALVLILGIAIYAVWHNELATSFSITQLRTRNDNHQDGSVYTMQVHGGFYLDEFVAQGGVSSDAELISFITGNITKGLLDLGMESPEIGCSAFTATTPEGDVLFGRNYDFSKTNTCLVFTEKNEGRHASISTVDLQFLGIDVNSDPGGLMDSITCLAAPYAPLDGINDAGVSCGIFMTYQGGEETVATDQNTDKPDFTSTTLLRLIPDYADSVEEAVEIARSYDLHDSATTSYHYMVADSTGKSAILEWVAGTDATDNDDDAHVGELEGSTDYQVITNFVLTPGYYDGCAPEEKRGYDRYEKIYEILSQTNGVAADENAAMDVLAAVGRRTRDNDDGNGCTVHSAVYNLTDKTMVWVPNENYTDPSAWYTFSLNP